MEQNENQQSEFDKELNALAGDFKELSEDKMKARLEILKAELKGPAEELRELLAQKKALEDQLEIELKKINPVIRDLENEIRKKWIPFISGAQEAELDCGGIKLKTAPKLNITVCDKEAAINWLTEHGYKDVMKWDVHASTLKSIATKNYEAEVSIPIDGLEYETFQVIKVS